MFWEYLTKILAFTGVKDAAVWQDVLLGVLLIPFAIEFLRWVIDFLNNQKPLRLLLKEFLASDANTLIFLSQLSAINENGKVNCDQKYVIKYPNPLPTAKKAIKLAFRKNIDPVWSEGDGECLASVYNVFGRVGKVKGVRIGDSVEDWDKWSNPTISIGFSPKTHKLIEKCEPIYFKIAENELSIKGNALKLDSYIPNDAGIVQKTFIRDSNSPVFILAGLGTMGTSIAGYYLGKTCVELGKLYGNKPFCLLLSAKTDEGKESVTIRAAYPKPAISRIIMHYFTYRKLNRNSIFPDH